MNQELLFIYIACFVVSVNYGFSFALTNNMKNSLSDDSTGLAENIYDLLLHGHSVEEVVAILNDNQESSYNINIAKLIRHIQSLLTKQHSKANGINIFVGSKEAEGFYAKKNLWLKIKNSYFVLKSAATLVIIVVVFYILYLLYQLLYQWLKFKRHYEKNPLDQEYTTRALLNIQVSQQYESYSEIYDEETQPVEEQKEQNREEIVLAMQQTLQQHNSTLTQIRQEAAKSTPADHEGFDGSYYPNSDEILDIDKLDFELSHSIAEQIKQAREVGLEPEITQLRANESSRELITDLGGIGERFLQQIEYARSLGLTKQ